MKPSDVIAVRSDGAEVTILDRAVETLKVGGFLNDAAARSGMDISTMQRWVRTGARLSREILQGTRTNADLTVEERDLVRFTAACAEAEAEGKMVLLGLAHRLSVGGIPMVTETTEEVEGVDPLRDPETGAIVHPGFPRKVRTTRKTETAQPDGAMIRWRLERRWPEEFGRPASRLELSGPDGGPVEVENRSPVDNLLARLQQIAGAQDAIDQAVTEEHEVHTDGDTPEDAEIIEDA